MRSPTSLFESDEELNLIDLEPLASEASILPRKDLTMDDYTTLATPERCVADFCLIPIGTPSASVSNEVAAVQRLMKASGLEYSMHSAGTTVEGSWEDVMEVIGKAHTLVHENGVLRVQTDIRAGTRIDKIQHFHEKVAKVESILASDSSPSTTLPTPASTPGSSSTAIQPPNTTTQVTTYGAKGPWISASMHLRRSFVPHNPEVLQRNGHGATDVQPTYSWRTPGNHTASIEFRTGFEGFEIWHAFYLVACAVTIGSFVLPRMKSGVTEYYTYTPVKGGKGFWG